MNASQKILSDLGKGGVALISGRMDCHPKHVYRVARTGFPASWFFKMVELCAERGVACPREAFTFKATSE